MEQTTLVVFQVKFIHFDIGLFQRERKLWFSEDLAVILPNRCCCTFSLITHASASALTIITLLFYVKHNTERKKDGKKETSDKFNKHDYQTLNKCNCKNQTKSYNCLEMLTNM